MGQATICGSVLGAFGRGPGTRIRWFDGGAVASRFDAIRANVGVDVGRVEADELADAVVGDAVLVDEAADEPWRDAEPLRDVGDPDQWPLVAPRR